MAPHGIRGAVLVVLVVVVTVLVVVVFRSGRVVVVVVDTSIVVEVVEVLVVVVDAGTHGVQQLPRVAWPPATSQRSVDERSRQRAGPFGKENQQAARSGVPQVESRSQRRTVVRHSRGSTPRWASFRVTDATQSV